ncbi:MAG: hypothetical protein OIF38_04115, partial [Cellvibrionaceae bacterium]|nr:hypothetical protein [Cellvibrionaceae bacterium]
MKQDEIEYGLIYHNICPRTRESEMLLERVRQRFGLDSRGLKLMAGAAPVLVKRLVQRSEASYLKDIFD